MSKRTRVLFAIFLLLAAGAVAWEVYFKQYVASPPPVTLQPPSKTAPLPVHDLQPHSGTQVIRHDRSFMRHEEYDGPTQLDNMTVAQIANYRKEKVRQLAHLNLFPQNYDPLQFPHNKIYGSITPQVAWVTTVPYYIANPYVLLSLTHGNHVAPFTVFFDEVDIVYSNGKITETHRGRNFLAWTLFLEHRPGPLAVTMANAWDAGFYYIHLVEALSENVTPETDPHRVGKTVYSQSSFYHVGQHRKNNISPDDRRGYISLKDHRATTRLVFHLWRSHPVTPDAKPDLVYEMVFAP